MATRGKMFSRSLLRSKKFWSLPSDKERLFFMLVILNLDNIGRGLGNKHYLKGKLYEKDDNVSANDCEKHLLACYNVGLLIRYEIDDNIYIQDPVHREHNKIVGNMTNESVYPAVPKEVMEKYVQSITKFDRIKLNSSEDKDKDKDIYNVDTQFFTDVITDLNEVTKSNYRLINKTKSLINARVKDGFTLEDFKTVHRKKYKEWGKDPKFSKYLRPETLYSNKFDGYLNQKDDTKTTKTYRVD